MNFMRKKTLLFSLVMIIGALSCGENREQKENSSSQEKEEVIVEKRDCLVVQDVDEWEEEASGIEMDSIVFDYVVYPECEDCPPAHYNIPKATTEDPALLSIVDSINSRILSVIEYSDDEWQKHGWCMEWCHGVDFRYQMEQNMLLITMDIISFSAHGDEMYGETLLFDLTTGSKITVGEIPFSALFSTKGYFDFLNARGWSDSVKSAFDESFVRMSNAESADEANLYYGNRDTIYRAAKFFVDYNFYNEEFHFWRDAESYVTICWAMRCYEPCYKDVCSIEEMKPYLSVVGENYLCNRKEMSQIERAIWKKQLCQQIEYCLYMEMYTGRKENETCRIAINYDDPQNVYGYLYDDSNQIEEIEGVFSDGTVTLHTSNFGDITFNMDSLFQYRARDRKKYVGCYWNR